MTEKPDAAQNEKVTSDADQLARRERLLKWGVAFVGVGLVAVVAVFVFNYIAARTGSPRSAYEFQLDKVDFWKAAVKKDPKSSSAHTNLGFIYLQIGREGKAIEEFKAAIKYDKKNADPYLQLGRYYFDKGEKDEAVPYLKNAAKYAPERAKSFALFKLGEIYEEKKDKDKAFDYYMRSSKDEPLMWNAHYKLGRFYEKDGKTDLALAEYNEAAKFNPNNTDIQRALERLAQ
ncbi:MAG: tetratricopeptide repeat protein [Terriglobia bacterium]